MPTPYDTYVYGGYAPGYGPNAGASNWANETLNENINYMPEETAYGTAFTGLLPQAQQAYYDMLERKLLGEGNANINRMLAERGMGVQGTGQGAQLAGLMRQNIGIARAGSEMEAARQIAGARYGALTRPTGRTTTMARTGWQAPTGGGGGGPIGGGGGGGRAGGGGGGMAGGGGGGFFGGGDLYTNPWTPGQNWLSPTGGLMGGEAWNAFTDARRARETAAQTAQATADRQTLAGASPQLTRDVSGRKQVWGTEGGWSWA